MTGVQTCALPISNINRDFLRAEIVYPADYSSFIHDGRAIGSMPPVFPLQKWAKRKFNLSEGEAKRVGWAIAKSIEERGIQPFPFLEDAWNKAWSELR